MRTPWPPTTVAAPVRESVLEAVGHTPLIGLRRLTQGLAAPVSVKAEFLNPGGSVKDRAAVSMVRAAEASGDLGPGGTIVEGTSGNTGVGLALAAAQGGYRIVVVVPDKTSVEKVALLRAHGAEVVVTSAGVPREDPRHVRNTARRIAEETPGGWLADQYDNPANPQAHYESTGPEIWEQTEGRITHFVAGVGTGGTISGVGRYLKEVSDGRVQIIGADPVQSVYSGGDGSPYYVEAIGHFVHALTTDDPWPSSFDREVVDRFERIEDREALDLLRRAAAEEGLLLGGSSGTALAAALRVAAPLGPDDLVVVLAPDSGRSYLSKYFDEGWLLRAGFTDGDPGSARVADLLGPGAPFPAAVLGGVTVAEAAASFAGRTGPALVVLPRRAGGGSRSPGDVTGTIDLGCLRALAGDPRVASTPVADHADQPLVTVGAGEAAAYLAARLPPGVDPVGVLVDGRVVALLARQRLAEVADR